MLSSRILHSIFGAMIPLVLLTGCGGGSPTDDDPDDDPDGDPQDGRVSVEIGAAGGSITSSDGALSLNFPAGALNGTTKVVVRPVTNTAPNAYGPSFVIEPANLAITKPVSVTLKLDQALLGGELAEGLGVGMKTAAGVWMGNPASAVTVPTALTGPITRAAGAAAATIISIALDLRGEFPLEITTVAYWRVEPRSATVETGETVPIAIKTCIRDFITSGEDGIALDPTCTPSARQGTWSVNGTAGGSEALGRVTALTPSSTARYVAPFLAPIQGQVIVGAQMLWPERQVTRTFRIPITIKGSNRWTGTMSYTRTGTFTETGRDYTRTTTIEGSGTVLLAALPDEMSPGGGRIHAYSITASDNYEVHQTGSSGPDQRGCTTTGTVDENLTGSGVIIPSELNSVGSVFLTLEENSYTLRIMGFDIDVAGESSTIETRRCPGAPDVVRSTLNQIESQSGLDTSGREWIISYDPQNPGRLTGTLTFADPSYSWVTIELKYDLRRP